MPRRNSDRVIRSMATKKSSQSLALYHNPSHSKSLATMPTQTCPSDLSPRVPTSWHSPNLTTAICSVPDCSNNRALLARVKSPSRSFGRRSSSLVDKALLRWKDGIGRVLSVALLQTHGFFRMTHIEDKSSISASTCQHHIRTISTVDLRLHKVRLSTVLEPQSDQRLLPRLEQRPSKLAQPIHRIVGKRQPGILHHLRELDLRSTRWKPADVPRVSEEHLQLRAVVCATTGVQACVGPVAKVAIHPGRHVVSSAHTSLEVVGAGEGLEQEPVALGCGCVYAAAEGWDHVVTLLVMVVAEELGLQEAERLVKHFYCLFAVISEKKRVDLRLWRIGLLSAAKRNRRKQSDCRWWDRTPASTERDSLPAQQVVVQQLLERLARAYRGRTLSCPRKNCSQGSQTHSANCSLAALQSSSGN